MSEHPLFAADHMEGVLTLEAVATGRFRAYSPDRPRARVFGGQVVAQAARAAAHTVDTEPAHHTHSLHAYFLRPGDYRVPIELRVERVRDGRSFSVRRVVAEQRDEEILMLSASFHADEEHGDYQLGPTVEVHGPDELPPTAFSTPIVETRDASFDDPRGPGRRLWFRVPRPLPDDAELHRAAIAYASDHGPFGAARRVQRDPSGFDRMMRASLDHVLWFHRAARADDWLLYDIEAVSFHGARVLTRAGVFDRSGCRIATVGQEILARAP